MRKKKLEPALVQVKSLTNSKSTSKKTELSHEQSLKKQVKSRHIRIQQQCNEQREKHNLNQLSRKRRVPKCKKQTSKFDLQSLMKKYDIIENQPRDASQINFSAQKKVFLPTDLQKTESGTIFNEDQYNLYYSTQIHYDKQLKRLAKKVDRLKSKSKSKKRKIVQQQQQNPLHKICQKLKILKRQEKDRKSERQHISLNQKQSYRLSKIHYIQRLEAQKACYQIRNTISLSPFNSIRRQISHES